MGREELLKLENVLDKSLYGVGAAKSWEALLGEIESGESQIVWEGDRPIREIEVLTISVNVFDTANCDFAGMHLFEDRQEFADGRVRRRGLWGISEKIKPGESLEASVIRAMREELGIEPSQFSVMLDTRVERNKKQSPSYPGLITHYTRKSATAWLYPEAVKPEYVEVQADKKTIFVWRQAEESN